MRSTVAAVASLVLRPQVIMIRSPLGAGVCGMNAKQWAQQTVRKTAECPYTSSQGTHDSAVHPRADARVHQGRTMEYPTSCAPTRDHNTIPHGPACLRGQYAEAASAMNGPYIALICSCIQPPGHTSGRNCYACSPSDPKKLLHLECNCESCGRSPCGDTRAHRDPLYVR